MRSEFLVLKLIFIFLGLTLLVGRSVMASDKKFHSGECLFCHTLTREEANQLIKPINVSILSIRQSPVRGLFEILVERDGKQGLIFVDYSKKYLMQGIIVETSSLKKNLESTPLKQK